MQCLNRYGALEGVSKPDLASLMGEEQVQKWRAGLNDRPPPMTEDHVHWHGKERKYLDIPLDLLPRTESLQDTINRTLPLWYSHILLDLKAGRNVMVVAHTNSLRGIIQVIDRLDLQQIQVCFQL
jgi:2,3-bisphosphoglycerate-dependent phosphoglycerate mutase